MARARCVLPVPGGPWSRIPRGGFSPGGCAYGHDGVRGGWELLTEVAEELWSGERDVNEVADLRDLLVEAAHGGVGSRVDVALDAFAEWLDVCDSEQTVAK